MTSLTLTPHRLTDARVTTEYLLGLKTTDAKRLIDAIERGFSYSALERVRRETGLPLSSIAETIGISPRTLTRRKKEKRLTASESDRLVSLSRLLSLAIDLFAGNREKAFRWFIVPSPALGDIAPLEMAGTETGAREVENLIGRLEYGVF